MDRELEGKNVDDPKVSDTPINPSTDKNRIQFDEADSTSEF